MSLVYIENKSDARYPKEGFGPSKSYPEYKYGKDTVQSSNDVYDMVRNCLVGLQLDIDNYGTDKWNPMGVYISPGDKVLIKPNWVMHFNGAKNVKDNAMECLVTHPSCLRAICDYCLIALNGRGKILIADAPMQDCDLQDLLNKFGYNEILTFYKNHGENVEFADLRKYQSMFDKNKVIIDKIYQSGEGINVEMGKLSIHEKRNGKRVYQVDNYDRHETEAYHGVDRHVYSINADVLDADVIVNFCKPKSHRLAGFTAAMKNMVGIAYNKASLPHRTAGASEEGGDAYKYKSNIKKLIDKILDKKIYHENKHMICRATVDRFVYGALLVFEKKVGRDPYIKGIWYGNDTIWRTVVDLNYIEQYADKEGKIKDTRQRKILNLGDMVIAGDHNGPCQPEPKQMGVIIASEDAIAMDLTICKMIGFPSDKIPMVKALYDHEADYLFGDCSGDIDINMNNKLKCKLSEAVFPNKWHYRPHDSWADSLD
jgi:uncharacterized protein (DUF362 family)